MEKFWGSLTKSGDEDSLRVTYQFSEHMIPLINDLDKRSPIIATHSMVACAAVAAGFKNVINLVIDNHAQWFVVVPGALNLVQGPSNYHSFLQMGVPVQDLALAGHWIPRDLVEGIPDACARRIARSRAKKPLRIVIPVGGAGAQRKFIVALVDALAGLAKAGRVQLFLNAADHTHMKTAFVGVLESNGVDYDNVVDMAGVQAFKNNAMTGEPSKNVTLVCIFLYLAGDVPKIDSPSYLLYMLFLFFPSVVSFPTRITSPQWPPPTSCATWPTSWRASRASWPSTPSPSS